MTEEERKAQKRAEYQRNKPKYIARAEKWAKDNPEKRKAYFEREDVKEKLRSKTRKWASKNREKKKILDREYAQKNPDIVRSYKAKRRAKVRNATPAWLTKDHFDAIKAIYAEAERLTKETGIRYEVDHIVPLNGRTVSGLHVPWNLRAITREENNRRPRIWDHNTQL